MAGSNQMKMKLLYILKILKEQTDEENPIAVNDLIGQLDKFGISAERKSIYSDLSLLEEFGYDICKVHGKSHGYFIGNRKFEAPELRLLIDAIQSARFITPKKTKELISKIESLTNIHIAKGLEKQIYVEDRVKCINEEVYYNVDKIHRAIAGNKKIAFQYYEYDLDKQRKLRNSGMEYIVSPYAMTWFDDNYYLIANYDKYDNLSHYRVDRICNVNIRDDIRRELASVSSYKNYFNTADYSKRIYSMFPGKPELVKIRFKNNLINPVIDKFGLDVTLIKEDGDYFTTVSEVIVSDGFIAWLLQFGNGVKVLSPDTLIQKIKIKIAEVQDVYK